MDNDIGTVSNNYPIPSHSVLPPKSEQKQEVLDSISILQWYKQNSWTSKSVSFIIKKKPQKQQWKSSLQ